MRRSIVAVVCGLLLAACGSDDVAPNTASGAASRPAAATSEDGHVHTDHDSAHHHQAPKAEGATHAREVGRPTASTVSPPSTVAAAEPPPADEPSHMVVPQPGHYVYDTTGFHDEGSESRPHRHQLPPQTSEDVSVTGPPESREVRIHRQLHDNHSHVFRFAVTPTEARVLEVGRRDGLSQATAAHPSPPPVVARAPFRVGEQWEISWQDVSLGINVVGTVRVARREAVTLGTGKTVNAVVLEVNQRLSGAVSGTSELQTWFDPTTGLQVKIVSRDDLRNASGRSYVELTSVMASGPGV